MTKPSGRVLSQAPPGLGEASVVPTDAELLGRYATHRDETAFEQLVRRHGPMVWRVAQRVLRHTQDVEDVFQATFIVLARKASAIARPELLGGWLHGVAHRVALEARSSRLRRADRQTALPEPSGVPARAEAGSENDWKLILDAEIAQLPEKYRLPLVLCDLEGLTCEQAAARLAIPVGTIKKRRFVVRELLRGRLARRGVTCSSAALVTLLTQEANAAVPAAALTQATTPGGFGTSALVLAQTYLQAQTRRRLCFVGAALLLSLVASALLLGAGAWLYSTFSAEPLHVVWRFERGPAPDLQAQRGEWMHRTFETGAMVSSQSVVVLPTTLPERPFAVTVQWRPTKGTGANTGSSRVMPVWARDGQALPRRVWAAVWQDMWNTGDVVQSRVVFHDRWAAHYIDGKLSALHEYDRPYPARQVLLALQNCAVQEIELQELTPAAVPVELLNAPRTAQKLTPGLTNDI